jgi:transcriptional regulator of arginine metabolism
MNKVARQYAIKEIINSQPVANQDELRLQLKKRGFNVTQATLSRDMQELGLARVASGEGARYVLQPEAEMQILRPLVGAEVISIQCNESMVVIKTLPGCASVVGEFLDAQKHPGIIGTLAGDNTLLVIPESQKKTQSLLTSLKKILIEGKSSS